MCAPLSGGAFHLRLTAVLVRLISLGGNGWSGSQDRVVKDTVSLAPPEQDKEKGLFDFPTEF